MITFRDIWNTAASKSYSNKEFKSRDYLYASELGGPMFDIWHKMKGIEPTTPPNARSFRKFNAGHMWEYMVKLTLYAAGVLEKEQIRVFKEPTDKTVGVSGRLDFIMAPGVKNDDMEGVPDFIKEIVSSFKVNNFDRTILEVKSISSMMFPKREIQAADNHLMQTFLYCEHLELPGLVCYISKDDCLMAEHQVTTTDPIKEKSDAFISEISGYYLGDSCPPKEEGILFEDRKFSKNWKVEYSNYLDKYGFGSPEEYRNSVDSKIARWNRVMKRIDKEDKMTDDNLKAIEEMVEHGFENIVLQ